MIAIVIFTHFNLLHLFYSQQWWEIEKITLGLVRTLFRTPSANKKERKRKRKDEYFLIWSTRYNITPWNLFLLEWIMKLFLGFQELGHIRIRQHVNPLSACFSVCNLLGVLKRKKKIIVFFFFLAFYKYRIKLLIISISLFLSFSSSIWLIDSVSG